MASMVNTQKMDGDENYKYLLFGKSGWIGGMLRKMFADRGMDLHLADSRIEDRENVAREIDEIKPTHVICAAGLTGRPNVDWCESHKDEVIRVNVIGTLNLADLCAARNVHLTLYATGCIYEYDEVHTVGSGVGFTEDDPPNFHGSFYSHSKALVEDLLRNYENVLILRVRMPISDDLSPRNFITKILKYAKVVNVPNSMTILGDMLPLSAYMATKKATGVYNFCNPGVVSHNEILDLYKKYVDPTYTYTNFTLEEQDRILKAKRSNNELDCSKLVNFLASNKDEAERLGVTCAPIKDGIHEVMKSMRVKLEEQGIYPDKLPRHNT